MKYLSISLLNILVSLINGHVPWNYNGSTPGLKEIVVGRCYDYQALDLNNRIPELHVDFDCEPFWKNFSSVFTYKDPCSNITKKYDGLVEFIENGESLTDKAMFWSGTKEVVHDFTHVNSDYVTLEDTFAGYFADNLNWCGCVDCNETEGINYTNCDKQCDVTTEFWNVISTQLAKKAKGKAYVMLNGTAKGINTAYYKYSHFGKDELPALGKEGKVTLLQIYVIHDLDVEPKEKCGEKTLKDLVSTAEKYGLKTECIDDPDMVRSVLCAKYPTANECKDTDNDDDGTWKDAGIALIAVSSVLLLCVIVLMIMFNRKKKPENYKNFQNSENA